MNRLNLVILILLVTVHLGTIRREENPITNTQTNPIAHREKMDEIKDGEKAAPAPSFRHFDKEKFLIDPPYEKRGGEESEEPEAIIPKLGDLSDRVEPAEEKAPESDWWYTDLDEDKEFKNSAKIDVSQD